MNYDLIVKLAKLANNNPNDNEANLAARKVCKLLAEGNYKFSSAPAPQPQKPMTYNDVQRSTEPAWKSTPPQPSEDSQKIFWDFFNNYMAGAEKERRARENDDRYRRDKEENYKRKTRGEWNPLRDNPFDFKVPFDIDDPRTYKRAEKKSEKQMKACVHCKKEYMTSYIGNFFECHACWIVEYERMKEKL